MSDESPETQPLTQRFSDLWGETATLVTVFATIIRTSEKAMFREQFRDDLEMIRDTANEGLELLDSLEEKPTPKFGFTREDEDGT